MGRLLPLSMAARIRPVASTGSAGRPSARVKTFALPPGSAASAGPAGGAADGAGGSADGAGGSADGGEAAGEAAGGARGPVAGGGAAGGEPTDREAVPGEAAG